MLGTTHRHACTPPQQDTVIGYLFGVLGEDRDARYQHALDSIGYEKRWPVWKNLDYIITRIYLRGSRKSGGSGEDLWKVDLSGHEAVAARSDAIEPGAGDLGDESVEA